MEKNKIREVWLTPELLQWNTFGSGVLPNDSEPWSRAYELLNHAEKRLSEAQTDDDRADVISILRRVLNHRLEKFKKIYLNSISLQSKPRGTIEQLEFLGIAKRGMVHKLLAIRNQIEYKDKKPPRAAACAELVEFVWYFLRSTDDYIAVVADDFEIQKRDQNGETGSFCTLTFGPETKWKNSFWGWFDDQEISFESNHKWLHVKVKKIVKRLPYDESKGQERWNISGKFTEEQKQLEMLYRFYFAHPKC